MPKKAILFAVIEVIIHTSSINVEDIYNAPFIHRASLGPGKMYNISTKNVSFTVHEFVDELDSEVTPTGYDISLIVGQNGKSVPYYTECNGMYILPNML